MADETEAEVAPSAQEIRLGELLATVDVSAPSTVKFNEVRKWVAEAVGIPLPKIATFYVSDAGNFLVRFRQPSVKNNAPRLGLALIPTGAKLASYLKPARRLIENGEFEVMALCEGAGSNWRGLKALKIAGSDLDATIAGLIPEVVEVALPTTGAGSAAPPSASPQPPYDLSRFCAETGLDEATARDWLERVTRKGQLVIQGPPGTGKTWVAERLAKLVVGAGKGVTDTIQFHPAWSYEDFVAGIAPVVRDGGLAYEAKAGRFLEFCQLAEEVEGDPSALVLDEFNRADVPRVFGELMHLLEYRGKDVLLPFGPDDGRFAVPRNVFVIATMNTADRSTVLLDHALRRRFSFVRLGPNYELLDAKLKAIGIDAAPLVTALGELNADIADPDYEIGISFFLAPGADLPRLLPSIWDGEVEPYLREILHSRPDAIRRWSWETIKPRFAAWT